jgi:hypothetical protein
MPVDTDIKPHKFRGLNRSPYRRHNTAGRGDVNTLTVRIRRSNAQAVEPAKPCSALPMIDRRPVGDNRSTELPLCVAT